MGDRCRLEDSVTRRRPTNRRSRNRLTVRLSVENERVNRPVVEEYPERIESRAWETPVITFICGDVGLYREGVRRSNRDRITDEII